VKQRDLFARCSSTSTSDVAWCEAYIAGVIDTLGANRQELNIDAENARFCLGKRSVSLDQARQALGKIIAMKDGFMDNAAGSNSVIATVLAHLCN
jgi:hypothetical protein